MTQEEITAIAREYAEERASMMQGSLTTKIQAELVIRFLLRRYALVEKSKVETKYKESLAALESNNHEDIKWGIYRLSLLDHLFPEIAKEVKE